MNLSKVKKYGLPLLLCCGLIACNVGDLDFNNLDVQPVSGTFAVPLGFKTYTIQELIDEQNDSLTNLQESEDTTLLVLFYTDSILYNAEGEFVNIDDVTGNGTITPIPVVNGPGIVSINPPNLTSVYTAPNGEQLDSVFHDGGDLTLTINSSADVNLEYGLQFLSTVDVTTGQPMTFTGTINGAGSDTQTQALANHLTRLIDPSGSNEFAIAFSATATLNNMQSLDGTEDISFDFTYSNQTFSLIYGKLGQDTVNVGNEAIEIDFFEDSGDEGFFLGNPVFRFTFDNSFGVPVATDFSGITSLDESGAQNSLSGAITEALSLPVIEASTTPGEVQQTVIEINRGNSNINQLLSNSPSRLEFNLTAISNYYDATASNFVQPGNEISALIEVEIPLELSLKNYQQSFAFNLNGGLDTEDIDSAFLRVVTINELPFSGSLAMNIQDTTDAVIYSIPEALVFVAPFINTSGFVTDPSGASADIPLPPEAITAFAEGDRIEMIVTLNTPVSQTSRDIFVKILSTYKLEIELGLGGRYNYEF